MGRSCGREKGRWLWVFLVVVLGTSLFLARGAVAQQSQAQRIAREGASLFKAKRFFAAARAFERSYQLQPTDPLLLRYAGRAWQEVGHLARARRLLERYLTLENDAGRRASIQVKLRKLQGLTKLDIANSLVHAAKKHPGNGLEAEAALALEEVDTQRSLELAVNHWELARTLAQDVSVRGQCESGLSRAKARLVELKRGAKSRLVVAHPVKPQAVPKAGVQSSPTPVKPKPRARPSVELHDSTDGMTMVLYGIGALGLVGGAGMAGYGYIQAANANESYKDDAQREPAKRHYASSEAYEDDKGAADRLAYIGYGVAVVGAAALVWAVIRTGSSPTDPAVTRQALWSPWIDSRGRAGAALTLLF